MKKNGADFRRRVTQQPVDKLLVLVTAGLLYGLSRALDVFAEPVCRMATGKDELADNCEQKAQQNSFRFVHFSPSFAVFTSARLITAPTALE